MENFQEPKRETVELRKKSGEKIRALKFENGDTVTYEFEDGWKLIKHTGVED